MTLELRIESRPDAEVQAWCDALDPVTRQRFTHNPESAEEIQAFLVDAEAPGTILGYGFIRRSNGAVGWVIAPDYRNQGWGTRLARLLQAQAKAVGITRLISSVWITNPASLATHMKCGFVIDGYTFHYEVA